MMEDNLIEENGTFTLQAFLDEVKGSTFFHVSTTLIAITSFFAFLNNSIVLFICFRQRKEGLALSKPMISLTTADLLMFTISFSHVSGLYDDSSYGYCEVVMCISRTATYATCGSSVIVAIERYIAVKYASRFKQICTKRKTNFCISCVWLVAFMVGVPIPLIRWQGNFCNKQYSFDAVFTAIMVIILVVPAFVTSVFYVLTYRHLKKESTNFEKYRYAFITALTLSCLGFLGNTFLGVWVLNESCGFGKHCGISDFGFNKYLLTTVAIVVTSTSAVNPVVIMVRCEEIRKGLKHLIPRLVRKIEPAPDSQHDIPMTHIQGQNI